MPRGKYVNHKGRSRQFTSPEELQEKSDNATDNSSDEDSKEELEDDTVARGAKKGVAALIKIENPNRVTRKATQKVSDGPIDDNGPSPSNRPELSRREREQIEKQKARLRYEKLHAEGKTAEAKADLERLALIRQQRQEAAAKREAEKKATADGKKPGTK